MPTAYAYWRAAADFARLADDMRRDAAAVEAQLTDAVVVGGRLRPSLDEVVAMVVSGVGATAAGYEVLAAECRRRALACEEYTAALAAHRRSAAASAAGAPHEQSRRRLPPAPRREHWMTPG